MNNSGNFVSMFWIILISLLLILAFVAYAALNISAQVFLKSTCKLDDKASVALTFDDGPHPIYTPKLLVLLSELDIKATFFLIGKNAERHPEIVKAIVAGGHSIGSHSYSHQTALAWRSVAEVRKDYEKSKSILERISKQSISLFRPPFGVTNPNIAKAIRQLNWISVGWSVRSFDTHYRSEKVVARILQQTKAGDIILMHDRIESSTKSVEIIVRELQKNGLKFVNLEHLKMQKTKS